MSDHYQRGANIYLSGDDGDLSASELKRKQTEFKKFYQMHYEISYRYLRAQRFGQQDNLDILSHAFEVAWKDYDSYLRLVDGSPQKKYWFLSILKNATKYATRRQIRDKEKNISIDLNPEVLQAKSNYPNPEEILLAKEDKSDFSRILDSLSEKYSSVVRLRLEGFDYKEISNILDISVDAAEIRMRRALVKLKEQLGGLKGKKPL